MFRFEAIPGKYTKGRVRRGLRLLNRSISILFYLLILQSGFVRAESGAEPSSSDLGRFPALEYRNLGPFRAGAWIGDIAVPENPGREHRFTFYVAARNGGVWKTVNNGTTFFPIFDDYGTNAIGAVEVAPSNPDIVWVGTGEDSYARSCYAGNGIWKSADAGSSFTPMGLKDSHHIGRIVIHPANPDIVYAAVMGHLFSENNQRGVFKTTDGGKSWSRVLDLGPRIGVVDLVMNPASPDTLFAAAYEKVRLPWHFEAGGEGSRIFRTTDGGESWTILEGGLPQGKLGRIGIDIHRADPRILYAVIQNLNLKPGLKDTGEIEFDAFTDHSYDDLIGGEVYRSNDGGDTWSKVSRQGVDVSGKAAYSFNEISVDPLDPQKVYIVGVSMLYSMDGGRTWPQDWRERRLFLKNFGDCRTFWIDPLDPRHMLLGSDGGLYVTWDGGLTTHHFGHLPLGEIYNVEVDAADPYSIYAGLQDHETWKGPVNAWSGSVGSEDWVITGMWDGMFTRVNPRNNRWLYFTTQFGKHHRVDQLKGERWEIEPAAPEGRPSYRYTWTTPLELSPHNPDIVFTGGQMLLRSLDRGNTWQERSPDLTDNDPVKIAGQGHIMFCTITSISESPLQAGLIWVGTDDGHVHVTRNHGGDWIEVTDGIASAGGPVGTWVSRVIASRHAEGRAVVVKSGYREDVFRPFVYRTEDFGATWTAVTDGLPEAPVSVVIEDRVNPDLLFAGTDAGVFFTLDGGRNWSSLRNNMPPVPVRDLVIQPREKDLVVGTYGRGVWVTDISPLQEMTKAAADKDFFLFAITPKPVAIASQRARWGNYHRTGDSHLRTPNEQAGLHIFYHIKAKRDTPLHLIIEDIDGRRVGRLKTSTAPGLHRLIWDSPKRTPGRYRLILTDGTRPQSRWGILKPRITWPVGNPDDFRKDE